ncbi:MAG: hypothetical protein KAJ03_01705 [Gammaproteobacteria bacterium]|nr:hypothetical protein [Gammaproteobacteria bacterium]
MPPDRVTGLLEYKRSNKHGREVFALVWSAILAYYWIDSMWIASMFTVVVFGYCVHAAETYRKSVAIDAEIKEELGLDK